MKPLLEFRITVGHKDIYTPVYVSVFLYREKFGSLEWRLDGEHGDICETLPTPKTIAQAKEDARAIYNNHVWRMRASWI